MLSPNSVNPVYTSRYQELKLRRILSRLLTGKRQKVVTTMVFVLFISKTKIESMLRIAKTFKVILLLSITLLQKSDLYQ